MFRPASFSLASKAFLTAAVVTLIFGADRPMSQPLSQAQRDSVERIRLYDAQPVKLAQDNVLQPGSMTQVGGSQRWVF
ncbi:hypothetical protein [Stutzerimonas azotifigens]|uniref:hypothetical protein n=1 Tax=Stutzerimonas azotifigens TaxID=291995 RepID=UPI00040D6BA3|nr:hypothetical protein [Stutzerimonas azotifigens]